MRKLTIHATYPGEEASRISVEEYSEGHGNPWEILITIETSKYHDEECIEQINLNPTDAIRFFAQCIAEISTRVENYNRADAQEEKAKAVIADAEGRTDVPTIR